MNKLSFLIPLVMMASTASAIFGLGGNPGWKLLPPTGDWQSILNSFNHNVTVGPYVAIYAKPFAELQQSERNPQMSSSTIQDAVVNIFNVFVDVCGNFSMDQTTYDNHNTRDYRKALRQATRLFMTDIRARDVDHVISRVTMRRFAFQRINDILVASTSYNNMTSKLNSYKKVLQNASSRASKLNSDMWKLKFPRNIDLNVVVLYSTRVLGDSVGATLSSSDLKRFIWRIQSLGNAAGLSIFNGSNSYTIGLTLSALIMGAVYLL